MTFRKDSIVVSILLSLLACGTAFVAKSHSFAMRSTPSSKLQMVFDDSSIAAAANNLWVSTIDADIANISNDDFGLVFAGGIAVMVGGVLSAVIVGFLLEKGDLYASLAAESYIKSADDEEFWKSLSDEEQIKAREMLDKIKSSNNGGSVPPQELAAAEKELTSSAPGKKVEAEPVKQAKPADMFSDYGD